MDGEVSSMDTDDEGPTPTDLYCTEDKDALNRLYVRTRRRRKRRRRRRRTRRRQWTRVPNMEADDVFRAVPASKVAIACLPKTTVGVGEAREAGECGVCLDEYEAGDALRTMPCSHGFHERCIVEWLSASRLCPLCRFKLPPPKPKKDTETDEEEDERESGDDDYDDHREAGHTLEYL